MGRMRGGKVVTGAARGHGIFGGQQDYELKCIGYKCGCVCVRVHMNSATQAFTRDPGHVTHAL